jgi:hypothetical protein
MSNLLSPEKYERMESAVVKANTALKTLKAKNKKLKEENETLAGKMDKQSQENLSLREKIALLEAKLLQSSQSHDDGDAGRDHIHDDNGAESNDASSNDGEGEGVAAMMEEVEEGGDTYVNSDDDMEDEDEEGEEDRELALEGNRTPSLSLAGVPASHANTNHTTTATTIAAAVMPPVLSAKAEDEVLAAKWGEVLGASPAVWANDTDVRAIAGVMGSCSPNRAAKALVAALKLQAAVGGEGGERIVSVLQAMSTRTITVFFRGFSFSAAQERERERKGRNRGRSPSSSSAAVATAVVPGLLVAREILSCLHIYMVAQWLSWLDARFPALHASSGSGSAFSVYEFYQFSMTGAGKYTNRSSSSSPVSAAARPSELLVHEKVATVHARACLQLGLVADLTMSLRQLWLLRQTAVTLLCTRPISAATAVPDDPLRGAIAGMWYAAVATATATHTATPGPGDGDGDDSAAAVAVSAYLRAVLGPSVSAFVRSVAGEVEEYPLREEAHSLPKFSSSSSLPVAAAVSAMKHALRGGGGATTSDGNNIADEHAQWCRSRGFLWSIRDHFDNNNSDNDNGQQQQQSALRALPSLHINTVEHGEKELFLLLGGDNSTFVRRFGSNKKGGSAAATAAGGRHEHPLTVLCRWLGPLAGLSSRQDSPLNLRLAAAFESHWGSTLLTTIAVASATTTGAAAAAAAAAAADEFKRWRSIVQTFTAWEYDPDPPAARAFTKARTAPVVGALGDVGYGWRVVGSRVGGSSTVRGRDYSGGGSGSNSAIASSEDEEEEEEEDEEEDEEGDKKASAKGETPYRSRPLRTLLAGQTQRLASRLKRARITAATCAATAAAAAVAGTATALDSDSDDDTAPPAPPAPPSSTTTTRQSSSNHTSLVPLPLPLPASVSMAAADTLFAQCLAYCSTDFGTVAAAVHTLHQAREWLALNPSTSTTDTGDIGGAANGGSEGNTHSNSNYALMRDTVEAEAGHLGALLTNAVLEVLLVLLSASARGCIRACAAWVETNRTTAAATARALKAVLHASVEFLTGVPPPWFLPGAADSVCLLHGATAAFTVLERQHLMAQEPITDSNSRSGSDGGNGVKKRRLANTRHTTEAALPPLGWSWLLQPSQSLPCLVINLARRADRNTKLRKDTVDAGLLPVVLNALDAVAPPTTTTTVIGKVLLSQGPRSSNSREDSDLLSQFLQDISDRAASGTCLTVADLVPSKWVSHTWDSSHNHMFDPTCVKSSNTPVTSSERACAASHLVSWLVIDRIRSSIRSSKSTSSLSLTFVPPAKEEKEEEVGVKCAVADDVLRCCEEAEKVLRLTRAGGGWEALRGSVAPNNTYSGSKHNLSSKASTTSNDNDDDDWYLVMEDDAVVVPEYREPGRFRRRLGLLLSSLPLDWDILYLGHAASGRGKGSPVQGGLFCRPVYLWQLHAYVLRGSALTKLLSALPVTGPVDNFLASLIYDSTLVAYSLQQQLVVQEGNLQRRMGDSNIEHSGRLVVPDAAAAAAVTGGGGAMELAAGAGTAAAWKALS